MVLSIFAKKISLKTRFLTGKNRVFQTSFDFGRFHLLRILLPHMYVPHVASHPCLTWRNLSGWPVVFACWCAEPGQTSVYECGTSRGGHVISMPRTVVCTPPKLEWRARAVTVNIWTKKTSLTEVPAYRCFVRKRKVCTNTGFFGSLRIVNNLTEQFGFERKTFRTICKTNNFEQYSRTNCTLIVGYQWPDTDTSCNTISTLGTSNNASSHTNLNLGQYSTTDQKCVTTYD